MCQAGTSWKEQTVNIGKCFFLDATGQESVVPSRMYYTDIASVQYLSQQTTEPTTHRRNAQRYPLYLITSPFYGLTQFINTATPCLAIGKRITSAYKSYSFSCHLLLLYVFCFDYSNDQRVALENSLYQCVKHCEIVVSRCPVGDEAAYHVVLVGQSPVGEQHVA